MFHPLCFKVTSEALPCFTLHVGRTYPYLWKTILGPGYHIRIWPLALELPLTPWAGSGWQALPNEGGSRGTIASNPQAGNGHPTYQCVCSGTKGNLVHTQSDDPVCEASLTAENSWLLEWAFHERQTALNNEELHCSGSLLRVGTSEHSRQRSFSTTVAPAIPLSPLRSVMLGFNISKCWPASPAPGVLNTGPADPSTP
ncbi:hypothetical protein QYF61_002746 [Mycteria americana]|uniref:Uncharacterized protein n=1 Tax=Mycteria americana TaxID=33587 RepID=A0AAN7MUS2_MYCAM|nr:hypothetical protein QYF61_002746 [Mycteria americana]